MTQINTMNSACGDPFYWDTGNVTTYGKVQIVKAFIHCLSFVFKINSIH